jgi:N-acetylglucosaminyldiphosphoundecaprenol N-acetyl-beta-D-mannosaminyltransferase
MGTTGLAVDRDFAPGGMAELARSALPHARMFGLDLAAVSAGLAAELVVLAGRARRRGLVITPNVDHIVLIDEDREVRSIFESASLLLADGMPLVWLSRLLPGAGLPERVTGADLFLDVCRLAADAGLSVYFIGGQEGAAERVVDRFSRELPALRIAGFDCPPRGFDTDAAASDRVIRACNQARPDILFLCLGTPKQERWVSAILHRLDVGPVLCVGASLDFAAGLVRRAPRLLQRAGLEWAWRLVREPRRLWRRYLVRDPRFFVLAARELYRQRGSVRERASA